VSARSKRIVAVLSTPCSGTSYVAQSLGSFGIEANHESMGRHGIVCGWALWGWRKVDLSAYDFERSWRLIRHPLRVLDTLPTFARHLEQTRPPWWVRGDLIATALRWWVETHERIPASWPVIKVETMSEDWPRLLTDVYWRVHGVQPPPDLPLESPATPTRKKRRHGVKTWEELHELDPDYARRAECIALEHYPTRDLPPHLE
jgi:hypothetical protein